MAEIGACLSLRGNTLGRRGPGRPWGGRGGQRSPFAGLPQAFVEPDMLLLPIRRPYFDRHTGVEPFEGERFQLLRSLLISTDKALQVGFDGESLGLRSGADFRFEFGMNGKAHNISQFARYRSDSTPTAKRFSSGKARPVGVHRGCPKCYTR